MLSESQKARVAMDAFKETLEVVKDPLSEDFMDAYEVSYAEHLYMATQQHSSTPQVEETPFTFTEEGDQNDQADMDLPHVQAPEQDDNDVSGVSGEDSAGTVRPADVARPDSTNTGR